MPRNAALAGVLAAYLFFQARRTWWSFTYGHALKLFLDSARQPLGWRLRFAVGFVADERRWLRSMKGGPRS